MIMPLAPSPLAPERSWMPGAVNPTAALARFSAGLALGDLAADEQQAAKRHLLDGLGACIAGLDEPLVRDAKTLMRRLSAGGNTPIVGTPDHTDLLWAVYLMAASCHALELDDGNRAGSIHPGTVVVPALLGVAHECNADGASFLCAMVAGYEVAVSLAEVLHPHASQRGFQTTGVVGCMGTAAATGRLLGLDALTMEKALGVAASSGAGLFGYLTGGGNIKKLHPAHAAREGVFAALLAQGNVIEGPQSIAETRAGIFQAFGGMYPWNGNKPGHREGALAITRSYLKPYPCCRHIHPAIDGLFALKREHGFTADEVARMDVGTYQAAMPHATMGWESLTSAQLSFPYVMAAALRTGRIELDTFADAARSNPQIIADTAKIHIAEDAECCASYPRQGPARVTVQLVSGASHTIYVADPGGCPELPMSDEALFDKFRMMVARRHANTAADRLIELVWTLDSASSVRPLIDGLCGR